MDGIAFSTKFRDLITADHIMLNVENESRCGLDNALIVQDDFANVIQSYPMKNERIIGNNVVITKMPSSIKGAGNNSHRQFQRVYQSLSTFTMES